MRRLNSALGMAASIALTFSVAPAGTEPIVTTDLLRIRNVTSIDVAGDGSKVVFVVRSIETIPPPPPAAAQVNGPAATPEPTYANRSHLFMLDLAKAGAAPRQLTYGDRNDQDPVISPDGRRVAFIRSSTSSIHTGDSIDTSAQVWIMPLDGGEARQATKLTGGAAAPKWSPDGSRLLVTSSVSLDELEGVPPWPMERPKRQWKDADVAKPRQPADARPDGTRSQIRAWLEGNATESDPTVITRLEFQDEQSLRGPMQLTQLFLVDPDAASLDGAARRITGDFRDHEDAAFVSDGRRIVYAAKKQTDQHPDRVLQKQLRQVNVDGSDDRLLLSVDGWALSNPLPSRDGSVIAFVGEQIDEPEYRQRCLGMASSGAAAGAATGGGGGGGGAAGGGAQDHGEAGNLVWLTSEADEGGSASSVMDVKWMTSAAALIFTTARQGGFPLMTISPSLLKPAPVIDSVDGRPIGVNAFSAGGGAMVYSVTSATNPCVLMIRDAHGERLAYDLNPWVIEKELSTPREGWITRPDGVRVQYWIMEPTRREKDAKYPLALQIHGGPSAMWGPGEFTMWQEFQLLCSWGYGVVYANPRGSGGYGYAFQRGNFQNWGDGPAGDVLAVVDQAVLLDWVDRNRLVVTGGSYAGYLTAWIVGHDHRFKAAVAQRGVYDLNTFFGEGNAWRLVEWAFGGFPWQPRIKPILERESPFTYVDRITTPLLILHSSNDLRTGVSQSEMLYRALKEQGRPVEYVRYPNSGHDLSRTGDPRQRMDRLDRIIEFFERYTDNSRPAPVPASSQ